jgi:hypothetical protein
MRQWVASELLAQLHDRRPHRLHRDLGITELGQEARFDLSPQVTASAPVGSGRLRSDPVGSGRIPSDPVGSGRIRTEHGVVEAAEPLVSLQPPPCRARVQPDQAIHVGVGVDRAIEQGFSMA